MIIILQILFLFFNLWPKFWPLTKVCWSLTQFSWPSVELFKISLQDFFGPYDHIFDPLPTFFEQQVEAKPEMLKSKKLTLEQLSEQIKTIYNKFIGSEKERT